MAKANPSRLGKEEPKEAPEQTPEQPFERVPDTRDEEIAFLREEMAAMRAEMAAAKAARLPQVKLEPVQPDLEPGTEITLTSGNIRRNF